MTPTVTADKSNPSRGDDIILTCRTSTQGIDTYEFRREGATIATSSSNIYIINAAAIGTDDGTYTCIASINTVASDSSIGYTVTSK